MAGQRPVARRRWLAATAGLGAGLWLPGRDLRAEERFPDRPLTLLVPFAPGGIADLSARAVGESLGPVLGQAVVVDNRPSAGSIVASQALLSARPDGHTLLLMSNSHALSVGLFRKLPYDTQRDFAPLGTIGLFDLAIFTGSGSRWKGLGDLLAAGRATPGRLTLGSIAVGSTQHLAGQLLLHQAGIEAVAVPYRGTPAVVSALRAGEVDAAIEIVGPMLPQVQGGAVRVLAVAADQRHPLLPEVPTAAQAGLPGFEVASWNGLAVHAATPAPRVARLAAALREVLSGAALRSRLGQLGIRLQPGGPEAMQALLAREIPRWAAVIRRAKIEPE